MVMETTPVRPVLNTTYTGWCVSSFRFGLGHITLDFLATLGDRAGQRVERLSEPSDLSRWLGEAQLVTAPRVSQRSLRNARELREAIYRLLECSRNGRRPAPADRELVNQWARRAVAAPQIGPNFKREVVGSDATSTALAELARESVDLLTSPDVARIRSCAGCTLLFLDRSRPGQRRWCSMERCGNRVKTSRYRERSRRR
jgi:predicted RNA-binding Zn ribbon-like protein